MPVTPAEHLLGPCKSLRVRLQRRAEGQKLLASVPTLRSSFRPKRHSRLAGASASFADAFDLFIDRRILRTLCPNRVVARHRRPRRYGAVDATSYRSASRV